MALEFIETPCGLSVRTGESTQELCIFRAEDGYTPKMRSALEEFAQAIEPSVKTLKAKYDEGYQNGKEDAEDPELNEG